MASEESVGGFSSVNATPNMSAAAEELRRMALEEDPSNDNGDQPEGELGATSKTSKSLPCVLCERMIRPSLFNRCVQCELCSGVIVEKKCLREAMLEIASGENAVDSKGRVDFTVDSAGFNGGRLLPLTKVSGSSTIMLGKCGYKMPEIGIQKPVLRFVCLQCVDASKTPGRRVVVYDSEEDEDVATKEGRDQSGGSGVSTRLSQDDRELVRALIEGARSGTDPSAAEVLSDFFECSPEAVQTDAKTHLSWTKKGLGRDPDWDGFLRTLSRGDAEVGRQKDWTREEDAASARYFLQLMGDKPLELGSIVFRTLVKNLDQKATRRVSQAFEVVMGWDPNNRTFEDLDRAEALKVTLRSFVPESQKRTGPAQRKFRDLGDAERLISEGRSGFEGQSSWEAGAPDRSGGSSQGPNQPAQVKAKGRRGGGPADGLVMGAAGGSELQDVWTGMARVVNAMDQHDARLAGDGPAPSLVYTLCWTMKELEWTRKQMLESQSLLQSAWPVDLVESDNRAIRVQKALQSQVRPLKDMNHLELDHYFRMTRGTVARNWPALQQEFERFVTICLPKDPLYWTFGAQVTSKNQTAHHEEHKAKIHLVRWFLRSEEARASGLDIEQHWMRLKSQAGGKLTLLQGKKKADEKHALSDSGDDSFGEGSDVGEGDGEEMSGDILAQWGDTMNRVEECRNCHGKGHSAPFCYKARRKDLPCQLCLGRHAEKDCSGPGHVSRGKWRATVVAPFLNRIGGVKKRAGPGGGGGPDTK